MLLIFWFLFRCFRDQDLADNLLLFCLLNFSGLQFFFFGLLSNNLVVLWKNGLRVLLQYNRLDDCLLHCLLDWLVLLFLRLIFGRLISTLTNRRLYGQPDRIRYMFRTWTSLNLRSQIPHADRRTHSHNLNLLLLRLEEQLLLHLLKFACHHLSRLFIYLILTTKNKSPITALNTNPNKDIIFHCLFQIIYNKAWHKKIIPNLELLRFLPSKTILEIFNSRSTVRSFDMIITSSLQQMLASRSTKRILMMISWKSISRHSPNSCRKYQRHPHHLPQTPQNRRKVKRLNNNRQPSRTLHPASIAEERRHRSRKSKSISTTK